MLFLSGEPDEQGLFRKKLRERSFLLSRLNEGSRICERGRSMFP